MHQDEDASAAERRAFERYSMEEQWRTRSLRDERMGAYVQQNEFARAGIKQLFTLNGAALAVVAPLLQFAGADLKGQLNQFVFMLSAFIVGLLLATASSVFGYQSNRKHGDAAAEQITHQVLTAEGSAFRRQGNTERAQGAKGAELKAQEKAQDDGASANRWATRALLAALGSLAAFLLGAISAIFLVL